MTMVSSMVDAMVASIVDCQWWHLWQMNGGSMVDEWWHLPQMNGGSMVDEWWLYGR